MYAGIFIFILLIYVEEKIDCTTHISFVYNSGENIAGASCLVTYFVDEAFTDK
jgi:hypothetical protein